MIGILTYFGDARNLQGMPTSQWEDKDVGLGLQVYTIQEATWAWEPKIPVPLSKLVIMLMLEKKV